MSQENVHSSFLTEVISASRVRRRLMDELKDDSWEFTGSHVGDYDRSFEAVLGGRTIAGCVIERARYTQERPFVLDVLSTPAAPVSLALQVEAAGVAMHGISASLTDRRNDRAKSEDLLLGVQHVAGDLATHQGRHRLRRVLAGRKADVILERGVGGLRTFPQHPLFVSIALCALWDTLRSDGGRMIVQLPLDSHMKDMGAEPTAHLAASLEEMRFCLTYGREGTPVDGSVVMPTLNIVRRPQDDTELFRKIVFAI